MKTALIFLAIVAFTSAAQIFEPIAVQSISSGAVKSIEDMRDQMPCGFPGMGIPPMAPLKIPHKEINIDKPAFSVHGSVENFKLFGLNDFDIADFKVSPITSKVTFLFVFNNVNVDTSYDLRVLLKKAGFTVNVVGSGSAKFAIKDMHIKGAIKYSLGVLSGKLKVKTIDIRTHIGAVESDIQGILGQGDINRKMNEALAEGFQTAINDNEDTITEAIQEFALEKVNDKLSDFTLSDLIGGGGGGGDDSGESSQKEVCIPPEY